MKILFLIALSILIYSCASTQQAAENNSENNSNTYDESFDPNSLKDDDIVIAKYDQPAAVAVADGATNSASTTDENVGIKEVRGYRVQIIATKNIESASQAELEAKDIFGRLKHKVYLIFDAPNYKVRVGDVITRDDADEIRDIAKDYGYRGAFVVKSKVNISTSE